MTIEEHHFESREDLEIPAAHDIHKIAEVRDLSVLSLPGNRLEEAALALEEFSGGRIRADALSPAELPTYRIAEIEDKEGAEGKSVVVFLSGIVGTGPNVGGIAAELLLASQSQRDARYDEKQDVYHTPIDEVGAAIAICSSVSEDTAEGPLPKDEAVRAGFQAAIVAERIKRMGASSVTIVGYSLGGVEGVYMSGILQKMFERDGSDVKVNQVILTQSGGQYDQSTYSTAKNTILGQAYATEIEGVFPSVMSEFGLLDAIDEAREQGDMARVHFLKQELTQMRVERERQKAEVEEYDELRKASAAGETVDKSQDDLPPEPEFYTAVKIDEDIENAWYSGAFGKFRRLLKKRVKLLKPIIENYSTGPDRRGFSITAKTALRFAKALVVKNTLPRWVRETVDVPVARVWGENDPLFRLDQALKARMETKRDVARRRGLAVEHAFFEHSPVMIDMSIKRWAHMGPQTSRVEYARHVVSVMQRIKDLQTRQDQTHDSSPVYERYTARS